MSQWVGRGLLGSLRKRVRHEISEQQRENRTVRQSRYGLTRRLFRYCITGRSLVWFAIGYLLIDLLAVLAEAMLTKYWPAILPCWTSPVLAERLKDISGFLIAAQVGLLAVVSVAIGVVTLISQRDDGSSTNTDVRLYYSESLAYEIVASSAILLVVLTLQVFWPFQFLLHAAHWGGDDEIFKAALTGLHILWMAFNSLLLAQFLLITLRFVEPSARTVMRERYTANIVAPQNNFDRLIRHLYATAPQELRPWANKSDPPFLNFGYGLIGDESNATVEIETEFSAQSSLHDVWMRPLGFVLRRWIARTMALPDQSDGPRTVFGRRLVQLVFRPSFDGTYESRLGWVVRIGGAELRAWERWIIRQCFRFRAVPRLQLHLPTPSALLEELFDKVVGQIDKLAETGFRGAWREASDYHRFLIALHNAKDAQGQPLNFAQFGGYFEAPFQEWVRLYRRVLEKAIEKIEADDYFIDSLSHSINRLLPQDARQVAEPVVLSLLDIGLYEIVLLEAWLTRRTSEAAANGQRGLPGSTQRAYESVVLEFVGAWENVLRSTSGIYDWSGAKRVSSATYWDALTASWPFMHQHLENSAYYLVSAVWNEDSIGAARYRDVLVRWRDTFRLDTHGEYSTRRKEILGADLLMLGWQAVSERLLPFKLYPDAADLSPDAIMALSLRNIHGDVILITAAVALRWHMQEASDISAEVATALIRRQIAEGDGERLGEPLPPPDVYSSVWALFLRATSGVYGDRMNHRATVDGLVRKLSQMSERRMISGRVYSSVGSDGIESLYAQLCAMLTALAPAGGDEQVLAWFRDVAAMPELLADGDKGLQRIPDRLRVLRTVLANVAESNDFARGVQALNPNVDVRQAAARLDGLIATASDIIAQSREQRLIDAPYDPAKIERLRVKLEEVITKHAMVLSFFQEFEQVDSDQPSDEEQTLRVNGVDKAEFITPSMSLDDNSGWTELVARNFAETVGNAVWRLFWRLERIDVALAEPAGSLAYWALVSDLKANLLPNAALLAPRAVGHEVIEWRYGRRDEVPAGLTVTHLEGRNSGLGAGYSGTVNDVDVFSTHALPNDSRLVSSSFLQTVVYHPLPSGRFVEVEFVAGEDLLRPSILIRYALKAVWRRQESFRILSNRWDGNTFPPTADEEQEE